MFKQIYERSKELKPLFSLFAGGFIFLTAAILIETFLMAYLNPSKSVTVYINRYGEADFELVMITVFALLSIIYLKDMYNYYMPKLRNIP